MELKAIYDARASFYGKAKIEIKEDCTAYSELLRSYGTLVAIYTEDKITNLKQFSFLGVFSQTTTRHQKEFFKQKGLDEDEINEIIKESKEKGGLVVYEKD